jgi:TRAP-type mannitol/chloroaromatic compound transport system substrate-binding protein
MKRRDFLKNAGVGAAAGATLVAAQARAQSGALPTVNWRLAASWPRAWTRSTAAPS